MGVLFFSVLSSKSTQKRTHDMLEYNHRIKLGGDFYDDISRNLL